MQTLHHHSTLARLVLNTCRHSSKAAAAVHRTAVNYSAGTESQSGATLGASAPGRAPCGGVNAISGNQYQNEQPQQLQGGTATVVRRYAVIGGGFAGVATAYHLLQHCTRESPVHVHLFDPAGLGGGASGAAAGLLHPFTSRGRPLWEAERAMPAAMQLLRAAEAAAAPGQAFCWHQDLLRPAADDKQAGHISGHAAVCAGVAAHLLGAEEALQKLPGLRRPRTLPALLVQGGAVVEPRGYLRALWMACGAAAAAAGGKVVLQRDHVTSLADLERQHGPWAAVVVAAGAAAAALPEVGDIFPVDIKEGYTLQLAPPAGGAYPQDAPSVLGGTYMASHGGARVVVGASKGPGKQLSTAPQACGREATAQEAEMATAALQPAITSIWEPAADWRVDRVQFGVRSLPRRNGEGTLPLTGRLTSAADFHDDSRWWVVTGLGARGLVYHAWLGELLASAVVADDESMLPEPLMRWRRPKAPKVRARKPRGEQSGQALKLHKHAADVAVPK